jgi:glycosyltransferase involved in cell wall biosynthesis
MHVINAMFSKGLGGIEQSFYDYCYCLKNQGCKVTAIIHPNAEIKNALIGLQVNIVNVKNKGILDFFAKKYLHKILQQNKPDVVIVHGNRAAELLKTPAKSYGCPVVGITHNYKLKRQVGLDAMFATTEHLRKYLFSLGQDESTIYKIPNMIKMPDGNIKIKDFRSPVVIGTMGRFVRKKGFDFFIRALSDLKDRNIEFEALIGGGGEEEKVLKGLSDNLKLKNNIKFLGWVENKDKFFESVDIFVLPSVHEPFGIILLEAFARGKAVITSNSEGPREIARHEHDALIIEKGDSRLIADAIEHLINDRALSKSLAENAIQTANEYEINKVGEKVVEALIKIEKVYKR